MRKTKFLAPNLLVEFKELLHTISIESLHIISTKSLVLFGEAPP
jgi:hypothetical protein